MFDHRQDGKWWDTGLDLVTGCTQISPGCDHCWNMAAANRKRNFGPGYEHINPKIQARYGGLTDAAGRWTGEVRPQWQDLDKIGRARKPQVYTFWNDLFHPGVGFNFIDAILENIHNHLQHFYIICTKRPERALEYSLSRELGNWPYDFRNRLMLMISAENQAMANLRVPILLQIPGVMHGVSLEPLLGEIKFRQTWLMPDPEWAPGWQYGCLDWVICGGETGPHARPMHPDWLRSLRDECQTAGVPFFFKSWGEFCPRLLMAAPDLFWDGHGKKEWGVLDNEGHYFSTTTPWNGNEAEDSDLLEYSMYRIGKKAAGRLLDGREWNEVPALWPLFPQLLL
jgi:protein gp37